MNLPRFGLSHRAIVLAVTLVILSAGLFNLATMPRRQVPQFRRRLGLVFQDFKLIDNRSVFDNVALVGRVVARLGVIAGIAPRRAPPPPQPDSGSEPVLVAGDGTELRLASY